MIGPPLIVGAVRRGWQVTVFTRRSPPPAEVADVVRHVAGDRGDPEAIDGLAWLRPHVVVDLSSYEPEHVSLTLERLGPVVERYLLMSTAAVYVPQPFLPWTEDTPLGSHPFWGDYGAKKLANEELAVRAAEQVQIVSLRAPYLVGVPDFMGRLQFIADRIAHDRTVFVSDSGNSPIHLVAADDVAGALLHLAEVDGATARGLQAFNIGSRQCATLRGLVEVIAAAMGRPSPDIVPVDLASVGLASAPFSWGDMVFPFADHPVLLDDGKLRASGFTPEVELPRLVADFVARYAAAGGPCPPRRFPAETRALATHRNSTGA